MLAAKALHPLASSLSPRLLLSGTRAQRPDPLLLPDLCTGCFLSVENDLFFGLPKLSAQMSSLCEASSGHFRFPSGFFLPFQLYFPPSSCNLLVCIHDIYVCMSSLLYPSGVCELRKVRDFCLLHYCISRPWTNALQIQVISKYLLNEKNHALSCST